MNNFKNLLSAQKKTPKYNGGSNGYYVLFGNNCN